MTHTVTAQKFTSTSVYCNNCTKLEFDDGKNHKAHLMNSAVYFHWHYKICIADGLQWEIIHILSKTCEQNACNPHFSTIHFLLWLQKNNEYLIPLIFLPKNCATLNHGQTKIIQHSHTLHVSSRELFHITFGGCRRGKKHTPFDHINFSSRSQQLF